jgi:two-component system phosphate regulon response regulator PhoB
MKPLHLVIADDEPDTRFIMQTYWEMLGHTVTLCENGRELVACLVDQAQPADAVLVDVMMPVLSGTEAAVSLRAAPHTRALPIICLSAKAELAEHDGTAGLFDAFVAKPVLLGTLKDELFRVLRERGVLDEDPPG